MGRIQKLLAGFTLCQSTSLPRLRASTIRVRFAGPALDLVAGLGSWFRKRSDSGALRVNAIDDAVEVVREQKGIG